MPNKRKRDIKRAATILETAECLGLSTSTVQKVLRTDRNNEHVLSVYMELTQRKQIVLEEVKAKNELVKAVEKLIPFN